MDALLRRRGGRAGDATADDLVSGRAMSHLFDALRQAAESVVADGRPGNDVDVAAGFRHLLVLLGLGLDAGLRADPDSVVALKVSGVDNVYKWGMDCPDCIYTGASLRPGESYRVRGNRGTARYVGLQSMAGMASSANVLLDELDLGPGGEVDLILSAQEHEGNWLPLAEDASNLVDPPLLLRLGHRGRLLPLDRAHRAGGRANVDGSRRTRVPWWPARWWRSVTSWLATSTSSCSSPNPRPRTRSCRRSTGRPWARRRRTARSSDRGSWPPDEALLLEVPPPEGLYWSYSLGNPWWETIDYAAHQSSLERLPGRRGRRRDRARRGGPRGPGRGELARHRRPQRRTDDPALRPHRDGAGAHSARVLPLAEVADALPPETRRVGPEERQAVLAARRLAVSKRFAR